jgi:transcriptional regulator with XRE-family HTH domain
MDGLGQRMKDRARALGWSDAEVARRLGLAQTRYAKYATDRHEPNLATLLRICRVLGLEPGELLGYAPSSPAATGEAAPAADPPERLRRRIAAVSQAMDEATLRLAAEVMDALAARPSPRSDPPAPAASAEAHAAEAHAA